MKTLASRRGKIAVLLVLGCVLGMTDNAMAQADHSLFFLLNKDFKTASEVTETCLMCHPEASKQVMGTTHWTWEYTTRDGQQLGKNNVINNYCICLLYTSPSPRDLSTSRMPSSA